MKQLFKRNFTMVVIGQIVVWQCDLTVCAAAVSAAGDGFVVVVWRGDSLLFHSDDRLFPVWGCDRGQKE